MIEKWRLTGSDLRFLVESLMPASRDKEHAATQLQTDEELINTMLDDDRLFQRLISEKDMPLQVSPWLFFTVLLRRASRDLEHEAYTQERRSQQKVIIFDIEPVVKLLGREPVRDYLAHMLASFTRIESVTVPVRVRQGIWRKYRTNDMDVEGLMRYTETLDQRFRFEVYKRIADVCLFLSGIFPEYIENQYRYPHSRQIRPRTKGKLLRTLEDYETHGRAFYRLAAEHERARIEGLDEVLATLSRDFILAEKPLTFVGQRYIGLVRRKLFNV